LYAGSFNIYEANQSFTLSSITFSNNQCPYGFDDLYVWNSGELIYNVTETTNTTETPITSTETPITSTQISTNTTEISMSSTEISMSTTETSMTSTISETNGTTSQPISSTSEPTNIFNATYVVSSTSIPTTSAESSDGNMILCSNIYLIASFYFLFFVIFG